jgi:hypothetical protein
MTKFYRSTGVAEGPSCSAEHHPRFMLDGQVVEVCRGQTYSVHGTK